MSFLDEFNNAEEFDSGDFDGISIDEEDDDFLNDDSDIFASNTPTTATVDNVDTTPDNGVEHDKKGLKRTSLFLIGIALAILLFVSMILNVVSHAKKAKQSNNVQIQTYASTQAVETSAVSTTANEVVDLGGKKETTASETKQETVAVSNDPKDDWIEVGLSSSDVDFGAPIEGVFTITDIKLYARLTGAVNDKQVRSVAMGSISGLPGTYKIELPVDKALKLSIGTSFKIDYQLKSVNGYKLVGEIRY